MKAINLFVICALAAIFQGCVSYTMGPERSFENSVKTEQLSVRSVTRVTAKIDRPFSDQSYYRLKLVAEGRFVLHHGHSMKRGIPCLSIGFWPGCADNQDKAGVVVASIFANFCLAALPTLSTLFFEPFCDYYDRGIIETRMFSTLGLIGSNKYYRDVKKDNSQSFVTESTENLSRYELYGYGVMIDGVRYDDKDYGTGCNGLVWFKSSLPSGSRIMVRIVDVPSSRSDGNDGFAGMMGLEIPATIP